MKKIILALLVFLFSTVAYSQFTEFHPELDWFTIKGEHVGVHYHNGAERTAKVVAKIADEVWDQIFTLGKQPVSEMAKVCQQIEAIQSQSGLIPLSCGCEIPG